MTPQSSFLYSAPITPGRSDELRNLLATMNRSPGVVELHNTLVPFQSLPMLHFARVLVVTDLAASDRPVYNLAVTGLPDYLVFMGEIDGEEPVFRATLVTCAAPGLAQLFSHCDGFEPWRDLSLWLAAHNVPANADYVNWVGRTVLQVREEQALRETLERFLSDNIADLRALSPQHKRQALLTFVRQQQQAGTLTLTPSAPTPLGWQLRNLAHLFGVLFLLLVMSPFLLLYLPIFLIQLRWQEQHDPAIAPPLDPAHAEQLFALENHDVTNQFSVFGSIKPGRTRLLTFRFFLWITNFAARHIYTRGGLARVTTIHFARWVSFDGGQRMFFSSIYDGSLESYMDDFINKVGFGLNITFNGGIGYPRTRWLLFEGCQDELTFKRVLRRHQLPTDVWYSAHPGLTAANQHRNTLIRQGLEKSSMTDAEINTWLALL